MRPQSLMNFALRCVRIFSDVNSRAELVTLAPGLRLAQGLDLRSSKSIVFKCIGIVTNT